MSEYQYIAFRAIDGPVTEENLEYMRRQSSRAEITPWSFDNEYEYSDFRGNAREMLRRGYDIHLHYANFGTRHLMIRFPDGLADPEAAKPYFSKHSPTYFKDKSGEGGILSIEPFHEAGELEEIWEIAEFLERLVPIRAEILGGDLRPLYLATLAVVTDGNHDPDREKEPPVPAGLDNLTDAQVAMAEFFGLDGPLITAAARNSPVLPTQMNPENQIESWLEGQPEAAKNAWLAQLMADPQSTVRREILKAFRKGQSAPSWPTVISGQTIEELEAAGQEIYQQQSRKTATATARRRASELKKMAADPAVILSRTEELVRRRTTAAYDEAGALLADLHEALDGSERSDLAEKQARTLKERYPSLRMLSSELRRHGFLTKKSQGRHNSRRSNDTK
jgi:hypothetical protein